MNKVPALNSPGHLLDQYIRTPAIGDVIQCDEIELNSVPVSLNAMCCGPVLTTSVLDGHLNPFCLLHQPWTSLYLVEDDIRFISIPLRVVNRPLVPLLTY